MAQNAASKHQEQGKVGKNGDVKLLFSTAVKSPPEQSSKSRQARLQLESGGVVAEEPQWVTQDDFNQLRQAAATTESADG